MFAERERRGRENLKLRNVNYHPPIKLAVSPLQATEWWTRVACTSALVIPRDFFHASSDDTRQTRLLPRVPNHASTARPSLVNCSPRPPWIAVHYRLNGPLSPPWKSFLFKPDNSTIFVSSSPLLIILFPLLEEVCFFFYSRMRRNGQTMFCVARVMFYSRRTSWRFINALEEIGARWILDESRFGYVNWNLIYSVKFN